MNLTWNKNIELFKERFPQLYQNLAEDLYSIDNFEAVQSPSQPAPLPFTVEKAKNGDYTARTGNTALHSKYNPLREAQQAAGDFDRETHKAAAFFSFGLGYTAIEFCRQHPDIPVFLIEPEPSWLNAAFNVTDFTPVLTHAQTVIVCGASEEIARSLLSRYTDKTLRIYSVPAQNNHCQPYFESLVQSLKQTRQKDDINTNTLEKFAHLWLKNSVRNLPYIAALDGIEKYRNLASDIPFLIIAAGPSLATVLPNLKELSKRCITVCVNTSLHVCLNAGIEPDFIVLVDPQYACALHLEFLSSPGSVLITESAAWPSVFRFNCREKVLCSSMFPIGQYFEQQLGTKGKLGAGGSVTTTAWDFARICGTKEIIIAGMDLGFPGKETHIRGSQFEERSHRLSNRFVTAEKDSITSLISANPKICTDYEGKPIITDSKMTLFSWWFENNVKRSLQDNQKTYTLTPQSLAIEGIEVISMEDLMQRPEITDKKADFFSAAEKKAGEIKKATEAEYQQVLENFTQSMEYLVEMSKKGINLCEKAIQDRTKVREVSARLSEIDGKILKSSAKNAAALVFPTQRQLEEKEKLLPQDQELHSIYYSRLIYTELQKSAREYLKELENL